MEAGVKQQGGAYVLAECDKGGMIIKRAVCGIVVFIIIVCLAATHLNKHGGSVYTVDTVVNGMRHHPRAWAGRAILVRGAIIGYDAEYLDAQLLNFGGIECTTNHFPTVSACKSSLSLAFAQLRPGSIVRLIIAPWTRLFTYKAVFIDDFIENPPVQEEVAEDPPGTMVVLFHVPPGGIAHGNLVARLLRHIPLVASLVPAQPDRILPTEGIYHLRLSAHPTGDWQHGQDDGILQLP